MPWVALEAKDGHRLRVYREEPAGTAVRGAVIVLHEITGVTAHIRELTARIAAQGYVAVAPALFDRVACDVALGDDARALARGMSLVTRLDWLRVMLDVAQTMRSVKAAGRVGAVGYSFGGVVSWIAAARLHGLACAVSYYPTRILGLAREAPRVPVLLHVGQRDASLPLARVREVGTRHPAVTLHEYDAGHGFSCDHRPGYEPAAAALATERTLAFLGAHVGASAPR